MEVSKATGMYIAPSVGKTTIGELGPSWLARQQGHTKPSCGQNVATASQFAMMFDPENTATSADVHARR